jgi:hypothetical protein
MRRSLVALLGLLFVGVLKWAFDHFIWDWFITYIEAKWNLREATLIVSVSSYAIPLLITIFCLMAIYWLMRWDLEKKLGFSAPQPLPTASRKEEKPLS